MTIGIADLIGSKGRIYTYDVREDMFELAKNNWDLYSLERENITFKISDAHKVIEETEIAAQYWTHRSRV